MDAGRGGANVIALIYTFGVALLASACGGAERPPVVHSHVVHLTLDGAAAGRETVETTVTGQQITSVMRTEAGGLADLTARLEIERGRPTLLRVTGRSLPSMPAEVHVTVTPDRTDVFPLRSPLPLHVVSALVRRSIVSGRREFRTLPDGSVTVAACAGGSAPFSDSTCHTVTGLPTGPVLLWLDRRQTLAAAVTRTPAGLLAATAPGREASGPALVERFDVYSPR